MYCEITKPRLNQARYTLPGTNPAVRTRLQLLACAIRGSSSPSYIGTTR